jgi:small subunit ribosomal protein S8
MMTDPISDFLSRIRNGLLVQKKEIVANCSKMTLRIAEILLAKGYLEGFDVEENGPKKTMRIRLRYDATGVPIATGLKRISKPGLRQYASVEEIPEVRSGMGLSIVSTSKGVMTGHEARKSNIGGEILCLVW